MGQGKRIQGQAVCDGGAARPLCAGPAGPHGFLSAVLLCALVAGVFHPYLLGRDEPREAEIAREVVVDGDWIMPHLCGLPFLEKPPLYYNLVAAAYTLTDAICPSVAGSISALFASACAGVFLSNGLIGIFHVVLILGAFLLLRRRADLLKRLLMPGPLMAFLVPVAIWICLFYRDGRTAYLHEHFVNNTVGRFLRIHFTFPAANFYHADLGNREAWIYRPFAWSTTIRPATATSSS